MNARRRKTLQTLFSSYMEILIEKKYDMKEFEKALDIYFDNEFERKNIDDITDNNLLFH